MPITPQEALQRHDLLALHAVVAPRHGLQIVERRLCGRCGKAGGRRRSLGRRYLLRALQVRASGQFRHAQGREVVVDGHLHELDLEAGGESLAGAIGDGRRLSKRKRGGARDGGE